LKNYFLALFVFMIGISISFPTLAVVPEQIPVQGILYDSDDNPINGAVDLKFSFYNARIDGTELWTETYTALNLSDGFYTVYLGSVTPLDVSELLSSEEVWLGITVNDDSEMDRVFLSAVPFAFEATMCHQIGDLEEEDIQISLSGENSCDDGFYFQGWDNVNNVALCVEDQKGIDVESDPEFVASASHGISSTDISQWNSSFLWGDHSTAGYLTSYVESDPQWSLDKANYYTSAELEGDGTANVHWNNLDGVPGGFADGTDDGITSETDPLWTADSTIIRGDITSAHSKADANSASIISINTRQVLTSVLVDSMQIMSYDTDLATGMSLNVSNRGRSFLVIASINVSNTVNTNHQDVGIRFDLRIDGFVRRSETIILKADTRQMFTIQWIEPAPSTGSSDYDIIVNTNNRVNLENRYFSITEL
jgi:hypothetical protein